MRTGQRVYWPSSLTRTFSLDAPVRPGQHTTFIDMLRAPEETEPDQRIRVRQDYEPVRRAIGKLLPRERMVVVLRFGMFDGEEWTLERVAGIIRKSKERVRQLEMTALVKIRVFLETGTMPNLYYDGTGLRRCQRARAEGN